MALKATEIQLPLPEPPPRAPQKKKIEPAATKADKTTYQVGASDLGNMDLGDPTGDAEVLEGLSEIHSADYVPDKVNPSDYITQGDPGRVVGGTSLPRRTRKK